METITKLIGSSADSSAANTIFGDIKYIQGQIGTGTTSATVFEQMDKIQSFAKKGKDSADAALGVAKNIDADLGINGQTPTAYDQLKIIEEHVKNLQAEAMGLGGKQDATSGLAQEIVTSFKELINAQARLAGLEDTGLRIEDLTKQQAKDMEKVQEKLDEIDVKMRALQEAMKLDDVVVKTWYESEE